MNEKISVIVPCFNVEDKIDRCVDSLVNQTIDKELLEIILVNDASTDETLSHLMRWEEEYPDIIIVINLTENVRQGGAKNVGLRYASGAYIGFVDSDDYIEKEMYEALLETMNTQNVECVICGRFEQTEDGKIYDMGMKEERYIALGKEQFPYFVLHSVAYYGLVQMLLKREVLERMDLAFPEGVAYEDNFWGGLLVYYLDSAYILDRTFYHYCINNNSTVQSRNASHQFDRFKMEINKLETAKERGLFSIYTEDLEYQFIKLYFINGVISLLNHFDEIPDGLINRMTMDVKRWCPNIDNNILLKHYLNEKDQEILSLVQYPFVKGNRQEILMGMASFRCRNRKT